MDLVRVLALAALDAHLAAVAEIAIVGHVDGVRHLAGDGIEAIHALVDDRLGRHQADGVGVRGVCEDLLHRALFDHAAGIHDHNVVRHFGDDAKVVGDEHDRGVDLVLQSAQQVKDLCLNGHVQRRGGLVGDDQAGIAGQGDGDHHALAHTAGELMGIHLVNAFAVGNADQLQHRDGVLFDLLFGPGRVVQGDDFIHLRADAEHGVERRHRLLEDHRQLVAADLLHGVHGHLRHVVGLAVLAQVQADLPGDDLSLRALEQLHQRKRGDGLAAARFAHESHDLARADLQVDVLQDVPGTAAAEKALPRDVAVAGDADIGDDGKLGVLNGQGRKARGARRRMRGGGEERGVAAGAPAAVLDGRHGAETFAAGVRDARAARGEGTARAELVGRRNLALDRDEPAAGAVHGGHGPQKAFGVGMGGTRDDVGDGGLPQGRGPRT